MRVHERYCMPSTACDEHVPAEQSYPQTSYDLENKNFTELYRTFQTCWVHIPFGVFKTLMIIPHSLLPFLCRFITKYCRYVHLIIGYLIYCILWYILSRSGQLINFDFAAATIILMVARSSASPQLTQIRHISSTLHLLSSVWMVQVNIHYKDTDQTENVCIWVLREKSASGRENLFADSTHKPTWEIRLLLTICDKSTSYINQCVPALEAQITRTCKSCISPSF